MAELKSISELLCQCPERQIRSVFRRNGGTLSLPLFIQLLESLHEESHREIDEVEFAAHAVGLFKQMDVRGTGQLRVEDLSAFVMQMDLLSEATSSGMTSTYHLVAHSDVHEPHSAISPAAATVPGARARRHTGGERLGGGGGGGASSPYSTTGEADDAHAGVQPEDIRRVRCMEFLGPPINELMVLWEGGEAVELMRHSARATERRPRMIVSCSLKHHTAYRPQEVLAAVHITGKNLIATSSTESHGAGPHYFNIWDVPLRPSTADASSPSSASTPTATHEAVDGQPRGEHVPVSRAKARANKSGGQMLPRLLRKVEVRLPVVQTQMLWVGHVRAFVSASQANGLLHFWRDGMPQPRRLMRASDYGVNSMCVVGRAKGVRRHQPVMLAVGTLDGAVTVLGPPCAKSPLEEWEVLACFDAHEKAVTGVYFLEKQDVLVTHGAYSVKSGTTGDVLLWKFDNSFHVDGGQKASDEVDLLSLASTTRASLIVRPHPKRKLSGHREQVVSMMFSPRHEHFYTLQASGRLVAWDLDLFERVEEVQATQLAPGHRHTWPTGPCPSLLALVPSGKPGALPLLVLAVDRLEMFRFTTSEIQEELLFATYNASFGTIVSASAARVCVWDGRTGKLKCQYLASQLCGRPEAEISSVCLDDRGRKLLVGDETGSISVCSYNNGTKLKSLAHPHMNQVKWVQYLPETKCIASGALGGTVHVLDERDPDNSVLIRRMRMVQRRLEGHIHMQSTANAMAGTNGPATLWDHPVDGEGHRLVPSGDVLRGHADTHLNLMAVVSHTGQVGEQVQVWDLEMMSAKGLCVPPLRERARQRGQRQASGSSAFVTEVPTSATSPATPRPAPSAVRFLAPCPALGVACSDGRIHLFSVPECRLVASLIDEAGRLGRGGDDGEGSLEITALEWAHDVRWEGTGGLETVQRCVGVDEGGNSDEDHASESLVLASDALGYVRAWVLDSNHVAGLGLAPVQPVRRVSYNPHRVAEASLEASELSVMMQRNADVHLESQHTETTSRRKRPLVRSSLCFRAGSESVTSLELVRQNMSVVVAGDDGVVTIWRLSHVDVGSTMLGEKAPMLSATMIGKCDVNYREPDPGTWRFEAVDSESTGGRENDEVKAALALSRTMSSTHTLVQETDERPADPTANKWDSMMDHLELFAKAVAVGAGGGTVKDGTTLRKSMHERSQGRTSALRQLNRTHHFMDEMEQRHSRERPLAASLSTPALMRPQTTAASLASASLLGAVGPMFDLASLRTGSSLLSSGPHAHAPADRAEMFANAGGHLPSSGATRRTLGQGSVGHRSASSLRSIKTFRKPARAASAPVREDKVLRGRQGRPRSVHVSRMNKLRHMGL